RAARRFRSFAESADAGHPDRKRFHVERRRVAENFRRGISERSRARHRRWHPRLQTHHGTNHRQRMNALRLLILIACALRIFAQQPLPRAHAHNDYEHTHPLFDALKQGFGSIEPDIYLVNGDLLVAHNREDCRPERNLEKLYLAPLKKRFDANKQIIPGLKTLILLIDIKSDAVPTYQALEKQIESYKPMLTVFEGDQIKTNAVTIIL